MARKASTRRYSQAVFQIALEKDELEAWQSDLEKIATLGQDEEIINYLENPKFPFNDKAKLLTDQLGDIDPLALNLVCLLVAKGGITMVGEIAEEYRRLMDSYHGIEGAQVTTAIPLDDDEKTKLAERLGNLVGKKVVLESDVDSSVIGGIVARVEGKLFDGSTRGQLEALKREIGRARR